MSRSKKCNSWQIRSSFFMGPPDIVLSLICSEFAFCDTLKVDVYIIPSVYAETLTYMKNYLAVKGSGPRAPSMENFSSRGYIAS